MADAQREFNAVLAAIAGSATSEVDLSNLRLGSARVVELVEHLRKYPFVKTLNLYNTMIGSPAIDALAGLILVDTTLEKLNISFNNLMGKDIHKLLGAITSNSVLSELDLIGNDLDESAENLIAMLNESKPALRIALGPVDRYKVARCRAELIRNDGRLGRW